MTQVRRACWLLVGMWTGLAGCHPAAAPDSPEALLARVRRACADRDAGAIRLLVDPSYQDDLGGPARLEDDLRQLFAVYGRLELNARDLVRRGDQLSGYAEVKGKALRYQGPLRMQVVTGPSGPLVQSGLLTELRGVLDVLRQRRIAIERGSTERLDALISMEYKPVQGDRHDLMRQMRASFEQNHDTALMTSDVGILVERDRAQVVQSYLLVTHVQDRAIERRDTERLILRKEGTRWRIIDGLG